MTNGETVRFHAVIVSCQALAAPVGSYAARRMGILPIYYIYNIYTKIIGPALANAFGMLFRELFVT